MNNDYAEFARELVDTCIISDPWVEGMERFRLEPRVLSNNEYRALCYAVEAIGKAYHELCQMLMEDQSLLDSHFYLTPWQKAMWEASGGYWHGIARADVFVLEDGNIQICEINSDTPSGEPEAVVLNEVRRRFHPELHNPNENFRDHFISMVFDLYRANVGDKAVEKPTVGIIYPTDYPEDLSMIELYRLWFEQLGCTFLLGSPYNLTRGRNGSLQILGKQVDIVLRHYKTDWWSEREQPRTDDEEFPDPDPLDRELQTILGAEMEGDVAVVNPFGAVITQNKVTMAFFWNEIARFSNESQEAIRTYIPLTMRLSDVDKEVVAAEKDRWVLKSDYGCEGEEVVIGKFTEENVWREALERSIPERWVIQEFFNAKKDQNGMIPNYGLFLIGGKSGGIFTRLSPVSTNHLAVTTPTFIQPKET